MGSISRRALDGSLMVMDVPEVIFADTFSCSGRVRLQGVLQRFCAGSPEHAQEFADETTFGVTDFYEEYRFQGGTLRIGPSPLVDSGDGATYVQHDGEPTRRWTAAWQGSRFSLHLSRMGGRSSVEELVHLVNQVEITQADHGITLTAPGGAALAYARLPRVTQWAPGFGSFEAWQVTSSSKGQVPKWQGTRVRGGELFVGRRGSPEMYFMLVGGGTMTLFQHEGQLTEEREQHLVDILSETVVRWDAP